MKSAVPAYSNFTVVIPVRKLEWVTIVNPLLFIDLYSSFCLLPLICFVSCVIMSLPETNVKSDAGVNTRGKRFTYKPHHMILLMRQVAADNPFQYDYPSEQLKAWEAIGTELEKVGIEAQWRSSQLKCVRLLDDYEKDLRQPLKSGTEPELCIELNQLLQDVSAKRKEESERHAENDRAKKQSKVMKKRKEKTVSEVQAGKNIREASLMTMKRTAGRCSYYPDQLARILRLPCGTVRLF